MLSLSKRVDYALIALAHLAERPGRISPAREIAAAYDLPLPLLMNILKELNQSGWVRSSRGTKGGYEIGVNPLAVSLHDLILMLEGPVQTTECVGTTPNAAIVLQGVNAAPEPCSCEDDHPNRETHGVESSGSSAPCGCRASRHCPVQAPLKALNDRLVKFLRAVKLADIITPGRKVDVPLEMMGMDYADRSWEGEAAARPSSTLRLRPEGSSPKSAGPKPARQTRLGRNLALPVRPVRGD